jgi:hypothetical protein
MNNKLTFLSLYTENTNISLAVIYLDEKIAGRCLIWNIEGQLYYDKVYINYDWCINTFLNYFNENNINSVNYDKKLILKLDKSDFMYYPYLDTFMYLDISNNILSNQYITGSKYRLRNTNGNLGYV